MFCVRRTLTVAVVPIHNCRLDGREVLRMFYLVARCATKECAACP